MEILDQEVGINTFQGPMQPYPGLGTWSHKVQLPNCKINLHYYDSGGISKPALLLLHGLGDEADSWRHVIPLLLDSYRVLAPDLPGFGRSEIGNAKSAIPFIIGAIIELLDQLSISRTALIGHSMGAMIAQAIALQYPQRVERLALLSGSLVSTETRLNRDLLLFLIPGVGEWLYNRLRKDPQAAYQTLEPYYFNLDALPKTERDFLYQRVNERVWSDRQRKGYFSALRGLVGWLPAQQKGLPIRLSAFHSPTLMIWGQNDQINAVSNAKGLLALQPSAHLVIVPEAGHNLQQEKASVVVNAIKNEWTGASTDP